MIVIRIKLKVDQENQKALFSYLEEEAQSVKTLSGCLTYSLYRDVFDSTSILLFEEWDSMDSFNRYKNSKAFSKLMSTLPALLSTPPDSVYYDSQIVGP